MENREHKQVNTRGDARTQTHTDIQTEMMNRCWEETHSRGERVTHAGLGEREQGISAQTESSTRHRKSHS